MSLIKIKRSSVEGKIPLTSDLELGELAINTYDGKLFLKRNNGLLDYIVEVGGNQGFEVKNQTGSKLSKGTLVKFAGTLGSSGKLLAAKFTANGTDPSDYFMGVVLDDIENGNDGFVLDHGKIFNIDTSAYAEGTILYASATTAGGFTSTRPQAPNNKITVAAVVNSHATAGVLEVRVTLGSQLGNDELVELGTLSSGDILSYNSTNERFENTKSPYDNPTFIGTVKADKIEVSSPGGDEGGEILLAKAQTNTTLSGGVAIDVYQNKLRIFEQGGASRGVYVDLTAAADSVGSNLLASSGVTLAGTETLTNKTIAYSNNTLTGVQPTLVSGTSIKTVNGTSLLGSGNLSISGSTALWSKKTANYTAVSGDKLLADTTAGTFTITLPASPVLGDNVIIADAGNWQTTNLTVARNSSTIEGLSDNLILDIPNIQVELVYDGTTWEVYAFTGPSGVDVSDDTTTNATVYPSWVSLTEGNQSVKTSSTKFYFNPSTGQLNSTDFNSLSDASKKKNVATIESAVSIVNRLRGVTFNWKDNNQSAIGVIAQEVEEVIPQVVSTSATGEKSVSYGNIVAVLIEAVKEQQKEINTLKQKLGV